MNIKMIVTDLDETLLRGDKTISERSLSALKQCRDKGIKIVYATGRGNSSKVLAPSELFDGFVRMNGATAHVGDALIFKKAIPIEHLRDLLIAADDMGIEIAVESNGVHYANFDAIEKWWWITDYEHTDFNHLDLNLDVEKLYALVETPETIKLIEKHLSDDQYLYVSRDDCAMVMHKEAMKSKAVAALAEHWGITQNEIIAFGDDANDTDLLEYCGVGIAMGNALDEVKAVADYICDTNENHGVAKWLEEKNRAMQEMGGCRAMKVKVIAKHLGEGTFPTFARGTDVKMGNKADSHFLHWYPCEIDGHETFVPECFVCDGKLTRDYNPTELVQEVGDILQVKEIVYAWLIATNESGVIGWIPAEAVTSVSA